MGRYVPSFIYLILPILCSTCIKGTYFNVGLGACGEFDTDDDAIVAACRASESAGADFVKTSTGFHPAGGASAHAVKIMRDTVGDRLGVKASGGIRDAAAAEEMIAAGASRLGLSSSAAVLEGLE